ncbi:MotA/TolQ/ExbB proton channel family protein [Cytophagaceae bacterium ABcell3]|nr:MotA/TolQ/ExbB proton channel family protein [Cytophagaceae bacterium ABcell3]
MNKKKVNLPSNFALIVIPLAIAICYTLFFTVFGHPSNFVDNDPDNHPLPGNYLGIVYKGGLVIPMLMAFILMVITFSIERFISLKMAVGNGKIADFTQNLKKHITLGDLEGAKELCDLQQGSVGNVVHSVVEKMQEVAKDPTMNTDQKLQAVREEHEESTALEMPMLEKNLNILATLASIATLVGLLGTVFGMIKAFAALATAGSPDAVALANGISEALINTALGIAGSTLAIVAYNFFTGKIDNLTNALDEIAYSISKQVSSNIKKVTNNQKVAAN